MIILWALLPAIIAVGGGIYDPIGHALREQAGLAAGFVLLADEARPPHVAQ